MTGNVFCIATKDLSPRQQDTFAGLIKSSQHGIDYRKAHVHADLWGFGFDPQRRLIGHGIKKRSRKDIPQLKVSDIRADGIHVQPSKTKKTSGKRLIIEWDKGGELRAVIDKILRVPPRRIGDAPVFITMDGNSYINANGQARAVPCLAFCDATAAR